MVQLIAAPRYKPEGTGFHPDVVIGILVLESTQSLGMFSGVKGSRQSRDLGVSTSENLTYAQFITNLCIEIMRF